MGKSIGIQTIMRHIFQDGTYKNSLSMKREVFVGRYSLQHYYIEDGVIIEVQAFANKAGYWCNVEI